MTGKRRADQALVDDGLVESRSKAQALIMAGKVYQGEQKIAKSGQMIAPGVPLAVRGQDHPWVSRGGMKLAKALEHFNLDPTGMICADIGASTGGFSDVLLHHGAKHVYAVDVGHGQLAWKLREDARVTVLERTNARYLTTEQIPTPLDMIVCDASFIGLRTILPAAMALAAPGAVLVALIKPQFEAGREHIGKGGVVRDPAIHHDVCAMIETWLAAQTGWTVMGITESPITGPEGNIEFLIGGRYIPTTSSQST